MNCTAKPLEKPKQDRLHNFLAHPDFTLLRNCIAAEIAQFEAKALKAAPWADKTANGKTAFDAAMKEILDRSTLLKLLDGYAAESYQFFDVTLTA